MICAERKNPKILAGMSFLGEGIKGNFYSFCLYFSVFAKYSAVAITIIYNIIIFIIKKKIPKTHWRAWYWDNWDVSLKRDGSRSSDHSLQECSQNPARFGDSHRRAKEPPGSSAGLSQVRPLCSCLLLEAKSVTQLVGGSAPFWASLSSGTLLTRQAEEYWQVGRGLDLLGL